MFVLNRLNGFLLCCFLTLTVTISSSAIGQSNSQNNRPRFDPTLIDGKFFEEYERRLNAILKTRRDEEKEFVKLVVAQVKADKIPTYLIDISFQWVRNKRPETDAPFIYFERVLRLNAEKLGIEDEIPPFDRNLYVNRPGQTQQSTRTPTRTPTRTSDNVFSRLSRLFR